MPFEPPILTLTKITTPTTYHLEPVDADKFHHGFGWAICTVNDASGSLAIQSDWGDWQYRWGADPKSLGAPTLTHFIGTRGSSHYIAGKLTSSAQRANFDADATIAKMRTRLAERRREQAHAGERRVMAYLGTKEEPLTAELARELWDALDDLRDTDRSADLFLDRFYRIPGHGWISEEPWNYVENSPDTSYTILLESIVPALIAACKVTAAERDMAARPECNNYSPPWFTGRWRDWHRGHGCNKDDGKPRTPEGEAEIAAGGAA